MVSGSQATVRTCNDHNSSKVRSFSSRCGRQNTLSLLTVITKVLVECIIEPASNELGPTCVSNFNEAIKRKCRNWQNILPYRLPVSFISCDQAALQMVFSVRLSVRLSVCPSVRLSVCHTFFTMFPSSYHHEIFRSYYHGQKWCPCKRSRSEVKGQGLRGHDPT